MTRAVMGNPRFSSSTPARVPVVDRHGYLRLGLLLFPGALADSVLELRNLFGDLLSRLFSADTGEQTRYSCYNLPPEGTVTIHKGQQ
jgi:hypothetical protein